MSPAHIVLAAGVALLSSLPAMAQTTHRPETECSAAVMTAEATLPAQRLGCLKRRVDGSDNIGSIDTDVLHKLLRQIAYGQSITTPSDVDVELAGLVAAELEKRGAMRPADRRAARQILLLNGRLDEAARCEAAHPGRQAPVVPRRVALAIAPAAGEARYWRWDAGSADTLREQAVDLAHGTHLIVIASPGCHFCPFAADAIVKDAALTRLFRDTLWITRSESGFNARYYKRWANAHPTLPMVVVFDLHPWVVPDQCSTPTFQFIRDGRVVKSVLGWTATSADALCAAGLGLGMLSGN